MPAVGRRPSNRSSQRQIICYLDSDFMEAIKLHARQRGFSLQQTLGRAINAELANLGYPPALTATSQHVFTRIAQAAKPRTLVGTRVSRLGRKGLAGWFDRKEVETLSEISNSINVSFQALAEAGLHTLVRESRPSNPMDLLEETDVSPSTT